MSSENLRHLNRISDVNSNKGVKFLHKAASPGSHCPLHTTLATIKRLGNVSSLVVGMPECGYYSRFVMTSPYGRNGELHYLYEMDSNEVVFGCREGLMDAIRQMDREGAKVIFIVVTCIPELIGEDIESVITELKGEINAKLLFTNVAHFTRNGYQAGFFNTISKLPDIAEGIIPARDGSNINILGSAGSSEMLLFNQSLIEGGYKINILDNNSSLEDILSSVDGKISIVLSPKMMKLAKKLEEKYGIPYFCLHNLYSCDDITIKYENILEMLNSKHLNVLQELKAELLQLEEECKTILKGRKFITSNPELDTIPYAAYLSSLGMLPVLLHVEEFYEENMELCSSLKAYGQDPYVCYISDVSRLMNVIEEEDIFISFGNCEDMRQEKIISDLDLNKMAELSGYSRSIALLEKIMHRLGSSGKEA
ncbi:MAG: oxidoreductase/nitrogenase component 1 [Eubacterium sp.]|jgi:nitrogenase molybdenum-iron protein alpha/beta subunit|nr:oxidoreductase/nitrogenase component 1 [Eubacterium sp.]